MSEQDTPKDPTGTIGWSECMTPNPEAAIAFYTKLLGWTTETMDMGGGIEYTMFMNNGAPVAGLMGITPEMGDVPPHWMSYIVVKDIAASEAKITELGGTVIRPSMKVGDKGIMVVMADPTGAHIALWQELG